MSSPSRVAYLSATAAAVALAFATSAGAVGGNLPNGGFPQVQPGTANLLNLSGGAHFILAYSAGLVFYEPTNAAAFAMAPYGIALDGVTVLPNPTTTTSSSGTTTTAPSPTTVTTSGGSGSGGTTSGGTTSGGTTSGSTTSGGSGGSGGTTSGSGGTTVVSDPVIVSAPVGP